MARPTLDDLVPLGAFEEQVALALVHAEPEAFGMNVRREIESRTGRDVAIGAVYATLDRLESKGLITSERSSGQGPSRRVFHLTVLGVEALRVTKRQREELWRGVDLREVRGER